MYVCVHVCACVYMYVCLHVHWHLKLSGGPTLYNWHSLVYINHPLYMHIISGCSQQSYRILSDSGYFGDSSPGSCLQSL